MRHTLARLLARTTDRLPPAAERQLLVWRSHAAAGAPTIGLPSARRALVVAPHPDDETLACGGTVAALAASGTDVRVLVLTDGDGAKVDLPAGELATRRRAEVAAACAALGVPAPVLLGLRDGGLAGAVPTIADALRSHLADHRPDVVLLPWFGDDHPDHHAANRALAAVAAGPAVGDPLVLGGEIWTPAPITRLVDITTVEPRLRAAVAAHLTAARSFDLDAVVALKRYRSVHGLRGRGLAEGFLAAPLSLYAELVGAEGGR